MKILDKVKSFFSAAFSSQEDAILMININNTFLVHLSTLKNIELAESNKVIEHKDLAHIFMLNVFDLDLDECIISDESTLADFSDCNIPDIHKLGATNKELIELGKKFTLHLVLTLYGIEVKITDKIVDIFEKINYMNKIKENKNE
jgi:hypothetical protein